MRSNSRSCSRARRLSLAFLAWAVLVAVALGASGCASIKKAIQKRLQRGKPPAYEAPAARFAVEEVQRWNRDLYRRHYLFWRGWSQELERDLGSNAKRERQDLRETARHLASMRAYLTGEAAEKMDASIRELEGVRERLAQPARSAADNAILSREIARMNTTVAREFSFERVKPFLKPDALPFDLKAYAESGEPSQ